MAGGVPAPRNHAEVVGLVAYSRDDSFRAYSIDASFMTLLSTAQYLARDTRRDPRSHLMLIAVAVTMAACAVALVAYLLWPTWGTRSAGAPDRMPISVGATLFNAPTSAIRRKIQRHSGPQERVDLSFVFPSLEAPETPRHVSADTVEDKAAQPIDRIFLSIAAHREALAPELRVRTIYPRYLDQAATPVNDGLTMRTFRDGSPYANEDLFSAAAPEINARCTRDGLTPGMCLSERRVGGADLTFRFPRTWLSQWREVASAMERLTAQMHGPRG